MARSKNICGGGAPMPRKKRDSSQNLSAVIPAIRVTEEQLSLLRSYASASEMQLSDYIRSVLFHRIEKRTKIYQIDIDSVRLLNRIVVMLRNFSSSDDLLEIIDMIKDVVIKISMCCDNTSYRSDRIDEK